MSISSSSDGINMTLDLLLSAPCPPPVDYYFSDFAIFAGQLNLTDGEINTIAGHCNIPSDPTTSPTVQTTPTDADTTTFYKVPSTANTLFTDVNSESTASEEITTVVKTTGTIEGSTVTDFTPTEKVERALTAQAGGLSGGIIALIVLLVIAVCFGAFVIWRYRKNIRTFKLPRGLSKRSDANGDKGKKRFQYDNQISYEQTLDGKGGTLRLETIPGNDKDCFDTTGKQETEIDNNVTQPNSSDEDSVLGHKLSVDDISIDIENTAESVSADENNKDQSRPDSNHSTIETNVVNENVTSQSKKTETTETYPKDEVANKVNTSKDDTSNKDISVPTDNAVRNPSTEDVHIDNASSSIPSNGNDNLTESGNESEQSSEMTESKDLGKDDRLSDVMDPMPGEDTLEDDSEDQSKTELDNMAPTSDVSKDPQTVEDAACEEIDIMESSDLSKGHTASNGTHTELRENEFESQNSETEPNSMAPKTSQIIENAIHL